MEEEILAANADAVVAPEGNADPVVETVEPVDPQEQKITKIVSERIKKEQERISLEAESRGRMTEKQRTDALIARLFPDQGFTTAEQVEEALAQREREEEAARQNVPVEILMKLQTTEATANQALSKLSQYERKELMAKEAEALSTNPQWGEFYKAHSAEIHGIADKLNCDLGTAKLLALEQIGIPKVDEEAISNRAIQDYLDKKRAFKPVEGSGATPVTIVSKALNFDEAGKNGAAMLRASREKG